MSSVLVSEMSTFAADGCFEIGYSSEGGAEVRVPLGEAWSVPFGKGRPVPRFASRKAQRHLSGLWWRDHFQPLILHA